jgi:predicted double-glycine peptidase
MVRNVLFFLILISVSTKNSVAQGLRSPVRDPIRSFQRPVVSWTAIRDQNVVLQQKDFSCGAAALATVLRYYWGKDIQEADVLDSVSIALKPEALKERTENGLSLADLKVVSDRMGYDAAVGKLDNLQKLGESKIPLIVPVNLSGTDHFVVYRGMCNGFVFLADPIRGNVRLDAADFEKAWIQNAVLVVTLPDMTSSAVSRLGIRSDEVHLARLNSQVIRRQISSIQK